MRKFLTQICRQEDQGAEQQDPDHAIDHDRTFGGSLGQPGAGAHTLPDEHQKGRQERAHHVESKQQS